VPAYPGFLEKRPINSVVVIVKVVIIIVVVDVAKDCRARGLNTEDAMDRSRWRMHIGMIDDHDECEWVNVSSGTGSPGLSQTNSTEP